MAATAPIKVGNFSASSSAPYPPMEIPIVPTFLRPCPRRAVSTHRYELVDHHGHGIIPGVRVPVPAASVDGDDRHRCERLAVDLEGRSLFGSQAGERVRIIRSFSVEHDDQRQGAPGSVARWPGDGVAHEASASLRVEGP